MTKLKVTRTKAREFFTVLNMVAALPLELINPIPAVSKFRYAFLKTDPALRDEIKKTDEAFKEPAKPGNDASPDMIHAYKEARAEWEKSLAEHMAEEIEIEVHQVPLIGINDTVNIIRLDNESDENCSRRRAAQNNALISILMPMWKD